jgi:hypothetical protein
MANFENVMLSKSLYNVAGSSFTNELEKMDPSVNYEGTPLASMDAFERQLKRFDIKVSGANSDMVEKFFKSTESATLFPEYVARAIKQGIDENNVLPDITAAVTRVNTRDYRTLTATDTGRTLGSITEGAEIPSTKIEPQSSLVSLNKYGRMIVSSYETIKFQRLDVLTVTLKQIGAFIAKSELKDAVTVLQTGVTAIDTATSKTLAYADIISLWSKFTDCTMNTMLVSTDMMPKLLALDEFKNPLTGIVLQGPGKVAAPMGCNVIRVDSLTSGTIIGLDKNYALEQIIASDITLDNDRLINMQMERATITTIAGFAKIYPNAVQVLNLKA